MEAGGLSGYAYSFVRCGALVECAALGLELRKVQLHENMPERQLFGCHKVIQPKLNAFMPHAHTQINFRWNQPLIIINHWAGIDQDKIFGSEQFDFRSRVGIGFLYRGKEQASAVA